MKAIDKAKIQPITLSLIQKYSFTRQFKIPQSISAQGDETATAYSDQASVTESEDSKQDLYAEKMIYLKTIRLGFLNIGTKIENLEIFEHLENLYLQNNKIQDIGLGLKFNTKIQFLALQHNQIKTLEGLKHLTKLSFLDLSHNQIEQLDPLELPQNLLILKINDNPFCKTQPDYRKKIVLRLELLEELDRIKVIQGERMAYKGLIRLDVDKLLEKYKQERQLKDAKEKMEKEMYLEYMEEIGVESSERMMKSLDEFAKMEEFTELNKQFQSIMKNHSDMKKIQDGKEASLRKEVDKQVNEVMQRYSRQGSRGE